MANSLKSSIMTFILFFILSCIPQTAFAHNFWINSVDYKPLLNEKTGAQTKIYFGFGHKLPVHDFLGDNRLTELKLVGEDGKTVDIKPGEGGFKATPVIIKKPGANIVTAVTRSGYYTMYYDKDRLHHIMGSMKGLDNVVLSLYYENYAKTLINVGDTDTDSYSKPVGHNIEIIPLENPYLKKTGDTLKIKILHGGKPASFCDISATYVGFSNEEDYAFSNKTGSDGISTIRLLSPGQWLVRAVVRKPAKESLREDCMEEKYSATLTFEVE